MPVAGAHQDFAVAFALAAMEFIDWHGAKLIGRPKNLKDVTNPENLQAAGDVNRNGRKNKKTGPDSQRVAERPGEFSISSIAGFRRTSTPT